MEGVCILVVDDHLKALLQMERAVKTALKALGEGDTEMIRAESGFELLDRATAHDATKGQRCRYMLVTDGQMPGLDGIELIERLQKSFGAQLVHGVVFSSGSEYQSHAERVGAVFVFKPPSIYTGMKIDDATQDALKEQIIFFLEKVRS